MTNPKKFKKFEKKIMVNLGYYTQSPIKDISSDEILGILKKWNRGKGKLSSKTG